MKEVCVSEVQWFLIMNKLWSTQACITDFLMPPCLSSCSLGSSLQFSYCLEGLDFILKTFWNHLTTEKFRERNLTDSQHDLIWQIISCAILHNQGRLTNIYVRARGLHVVWVCLTFSIEIKNYPLEIPSHFLILQYLTKKPECMLVIPDALVTNLATDCVGILSEIYIWTIPGYKSQISKLVPLELSINGHPARTEQIGLGILVKLKIN